VLNFTFSHKEAIINGGGELIYFNSIRYAQALIPIKINGLIVYLVEKLGKIHLLKAVSMSLLI